jgi:DNA-binding transcriptional LysR family regulator
MIKRTHLRHLIALVDTGGFTAAARRLNLTQPTLSASIAELERIAGTPLVLRAREGGRRVIRLTDAGRRMLAHARAIEREFRSAEAPPLPAGAQVQPLVLGVLASLPTATIAAMRERLGNERPLVLLEGSDADLRRRLSAHQIDAALTLLRPGETPPAVLEENYAVLLSARHPLAGRHELTAEELASETMIARRSCELLAETSKFFTARGVRPHFLVRSANEDRCLAMVRAGLAITTGPASLAGNGVAAVPLHDYTYRRRVGLVTPGGKDNAALAAAWEAVLARCAENDGKW